MSKKMTAVQVKKFSRSLLHINDVPVKIPGGTLYAVIVTITPKMAADWIDKCNLKNRNCRQGKVNQYALDITEGRWLLTHQAIAFDVSKKIISGQHRLEACVRSGKSIEQFVVLNCLTKERKAVDQTLSRNAKDVAALGNDDPLSARTISTARIMYYGIKLTNPKATLSPQGICEFVTYHREALDYVLKHVKKNVPGVTSATVLGPICRAFYVMKRKEISNFVSILCSGFSLESRDQPIIFLRNWLNDTKDDRGGFQGRQNAYAQTSEALLAYQEYNEMTKLTKDREEIFEL